MGTEGQAHAGQQRSASASAVPPLACQRSKNLCDSRWGCGKSQRQAAMACLGRTSHGCAALLQARARWTSCEQC